MSATPRLLILGLGNVLCRDDGLGVLAVEILRQRYRTSQEVSILDGGTLGLSLLPHLEDADAVIFVDAVRVESHPGTLVRLEGEDVLPAVRERLSVHQIGVADLLDAMRLLDRMPPQLILVGLVPESIDLCIGCSAPVLERMDDLVDRVVFEAEHLGCRLEPRGPDETADLDAPAAVFAGLV